MRTQNEMPKVGATVVIVESNSAFNGKRGKVVGIQDATKGRPYSVKVGKVTRKFRQGDVAKPSQVQWS